MTVLIILGVLFAALLIVVPLLERSNLRMSGEQMSKLGRWILPLIGVMLVVQLFVHYAG
jgi:hypothetical protein